MKNKNLFSLIFWILSIITIGGIIGSLTKSQITIWYSILNKSTLTPPNYVFPIAWTILYGLIGTCGWLIWNSQTSSKIKTIKNLYIIQLILNWSWSPIFFNYHSIGIAMIILCLMDIIIGSIIYLTTLNLQLVSILMIPYLLWITFATYLNYYIWVYN